MRLFTIILLAINLVTVAWLLVGARMELPPWEQAFQDTRSAIDSFELSDTAVKATMADVARAHLEKTEDWTTIAIGEYRRSDLPLGALTICNIVGLSILALKRRRAEQGARGNGR